MFPIGSKSLETYAFYLVEMKSWYKSLCPWWKLLSLDFFYSWPVDEVNGMSKKEEEIFFEK